LLLCLILILKQQSSEAFSFLLSSHPNFVLVLTNTYYKPSLCCLELISQDRLINPLPPSRCSQPPPHRVAQFGVGRSLHLVGLLGGGPSRPLRLMRLLGGVLVDCSASQGCSVGTWLAAPPRRATRRRVGRSVSQSCSKEDLVVRSASLDCSTEGWSANGSKGGCGSTFGFLVPR
jgi:hypothetical protein